jgi:enoyl-CoA hydratase/carnithine racemase
VTSGQVRLHRDGPVARIVLDRAAKRNALTRHMLAELDKRLATVSDDHMIRVVTLHGEGQVFCAGADTTEFAATTPESIRGSWTRLGQRVFSALAELPQTTVAVLSGSAFGGGLELALHCDFRVASEAVAVGLPEATLGTTPGWGGLSKAADIGGPAAARMLALTGRALPAAEAYRLCLIDILAPQEDVEAAADRLVADLLRTGPVAQAILKRALASPAAGPALIDSLAGAYLTESGETARFTTARNTLNSNGSSTKG